MSVAFARDGSGGKTVVAATIVMLLQMKYSLKTKTKKNGESKVPRMAVGGERRT